MIAAFILFVSIGLDTLAVSLSFGIAGLPRSRWARVGLTFALFEGLMPIVGLLIGARLSTVLGDLAGYLAAAALILVGILAIREALSGDDGDTTPQVSAADNGRLLLAALSVSLDELAVGFSLGVLAVPVGLSLGYIAAQAFVFTFAGLWLGQHAGAHIGERAELISGVILTLLGVALLVSEITGSQFL